MSDPLDKQLVEAVLTRPRRARADVEEAKLATRGLRASKVVLPKVADDEDDDATVPGADGAAAEGDVGVEVVGEDGVPVDNKLPSDAPAKLDPKEVDEPTAEELDAISADMIGIDDPVRMYLKEIGKVALLTAELPVRSVISSEVRRISFVGLTFAQAGKRGMANMSKRKKKERGRKRLCFPGIPL
jgi:hypothetical protein